MPDVKISRSERIVVEVPLSPSEVLRIDLWPPLWEQLVGEMGQDGAVAYLVRASRRY